MKEASNRDAAAWCAGTTAAQWPGTLGAPSLSAHTTAHSEASVDGKGGATDRACGVQHWKTQVYVPSTITTPPLPGDHERAHTHTYGLTAAASASAPETCPHDLLRSTAHTNNEHSTPYAAQQSEHMFATQCPSPSGTCD